MKARNMSERTKVRTNPFSHMAMWLTAEEAALYDKIKQDERDENYTEMQKGLDKFSRLNAEAFMTLLD